MGICENPECKNETDNPKYCSRACAAKVNNHNRVKFRPCKNCGEHVVNKQNKFCCRNCYVMFYQKERDEPKSFDTPFFCKVHEYTEFRVYKNKRICKKCASEKVQRRREALKSLAIEFLGGECQRCGYKNCSGALEFHHIDPSKKEIKLSSFTYSWEKIKKELKKCELLCANCHREVHCMPSVGSNPT